MGFRGTFSDGKTTVLLLDPTQEIKNCAAHGIPPPANLVKANALAVPQGPEPARGWILVNRGDLNRLNLDARCALTFTLVDPAQRVNDTRTWQNLIVAKEPQAVIPSSTLGDDNGAVLVELADVRHLLKNPTFGAAINSSYNVRSLVAGQTYDPLTLSGGVTVWTWAAMVADLWGNVSATLGAAPALPFAPNGTPEGWIFRGATAWEAITAVLWRIGCAVRADLTLPAGQQFTIVQIGAADTAADAALAAAVTANRKIHDAEFETVQLGLAPRGVRVFFHKQNNANQTVVASTQWGTTPLYSVDVAGPDASTENVYAPILDDMAALYDGSGTLTNSAALATRAAERSADFFRMIGAGGAKLWQRFSGLLNVTAGSDLKGVRWMQVGQGCMTEVIRHPYLGLGIDDNAAWRTVYDDPRRQGFYNGWPIAPANGCIFAQLRTSGGSGNYSWRQMCEAPGGGWAVQAGGLTGSLTSNTAWEDNANPNVPIGAANGAIVQLCPRCPSPCTTTTAGPTTTAAPTTAGPTTTTTTAAPPCPTTTSTTTTSTTTTSTTTTTTTTTGGPTTTTTPPPCTDWRFAYCCGSPTTTTSTTSTTTTTTVPPCSGQCTWTWSSASNIWTLTCSGCTIGSPCVCQQPGHCGTTNNETTKTYCAYGTNGPPCCATTTTSTTTTSGPTTTTTTTTGGPTTTTTPPPSCAGCTYRWYALSGTWALVSYNCQTCCGCPPPAGVGASDCATQAVPCAGCQTTTTTAAPGCSGSCSWLWDQDTSRWTKLSSTCTSTYIGNSPCCPNPLSSQMCLTVVGANGSDGTTYCSCMNGGYTLAYDGLGAWRYTTSLCPDPVQHISQTVTFVLSCQTLNKTWALNIGVAGYNFVTASCPLTCLPVTGTFSFPNGIQGLCTTPVTVTLASCGGAPPPALPAPNPASGQACVCDPPAVSGTGCSIGTTSCYVPPPPPVVPTTSTTTTLCPGCTTTTAGPTTTTTAGPTTTTTTLAPGQCTSTTCAPSTSKCCGGCAWKGDGAGGWTFVSSTCNPVCSCIVPAYASSASTETASTPCTPINTTSTTPPPGSNWWCVAYSALPGQTCDASGRGTCAYYDPITGSNSFGDLGWTCPLPPVVGATCALNSGCLGTIASGPVTWGTCFAACPPPSTTTTTTTSTTPPPCASINCLFKCDGAGGWTFIPSPKPCGPGCQCSDPAALNPCNSSTGAYTATVPCCSPASCPTTTTTSTTTSTTSTTTTAAPSWNSYCVTTCFNGGTPVDCSATPCGAASSGYICLGSLASTVTGSCGGGYTVSYGKQAGGPYLNYGACNAAGGTCTTTTSTTTTGAPWFAYIGGSCGLGACAQTNPGGCTPGTSYASCAACKAANPGYTGPC